jgi:acetolactate synthase-1/2/3 large subunit
MKTSSENPSQSEQTPSPASQLAEVKGADLLVQCLEREDVEVIFAYPGGASMEIHQGLVKSGTIRTILPRHEQGCGFMAHGYARTTGKTGVCMATSGPGATNLVTCIADAHSISLAKTLFKKPTYTASPCRSLSIPIWSSILKTFHVS